MSAVEAVEKRAIRFHSGCGSVIDVDGDVSSVLRSDERVKVR